MAVLVIPDHLYLYHERKTTMTFNSRDKLNAMHLMGSIGIAALVAAAAESWMLFVLVAAALIGASIATGQIRLD